MPGDSLFRQLCKSEVLKVGWHLAHLDSRDDFVSDPIGYEDFASQLTARLTYLVEEVRNRRYRPRHLLEVDVPKEGLSVRPGNVLPIEESIILHAIMYLLAPKLDNSLCDSVFSCRLHKDWNRRIRKGRGLFKEDSWELPFLKGKTIRALDPFEPWYIAWPEFDHERVKAARDEGYAYLTRTDIAAYFENIDLDLLETQLRALVPHQEDTVELLMRILRSWTRVTSTGVPVERGIPQGNDVSSFLGNIYLLPLDKQLISFCRKRDAVWFRYIDDVEVYCKDDATARDVVFVVNDALRRLHLNLQGSKTEILTGSDLDKVLSTSESEAIDAAFSELQGVNVKASKNQKKVTAILSNLRPIARRFRRGLPSSVKDLSKRDNRLLRRLMTAYGRCSRPYLKEIAFAALHELPDLRILQKSLRYLRQLPYSYHNDISEELLMLLEGSKLLLPYYSAYLLETLRWLHPQYGGQGVAGRVTRLALKKRADWLVRQKACELLTTLPYRSDHSIAQAQKMLIDDHPFVRRAACVLLTRGPAKVVRNKISSLVYHPDPALGRIALMWHRFLTDEQVALSELRQLRNREVRDDSFIWQIPRLWLLRCSSHSEVVIALKSFLQTYRHSRSGKVRWHLDQLDLEIRSSVS